MDEGCGDRDKSLSGRTHAGRADGESGAVTPWSRSDRELEPPSPSGYEVGAEDSELDRWVDAAWSFCEPESGHRNGSVFRKLQFESKDSWATSEETGNPSRRRIPGVEMGDKKKRGPRDGREGQRGSPCAALNEINGIGADSRATPVVSGGRRGGEQEGLPEVGRGGREGSPPLKVPLSRTRVQKL
ncbi:unnamed protein product, partial [Discosporangium mesarthrocarpum]